MVARIAVTKCLINIFSGKYYEEMKSKVNQACIFVLKKEVTCQEKPHIFARAQLFFYKKHGSYFLF
jgi:hypothetical protein